jgi:uncharacterized protein YqeY
MSELKACLQSDMKSAMKAGEKERLGVIRLMMAAIKQREVDDRVDLGDEEIVKQRRESIAQYDAAGRSDLSAVEKSEIEVIQTYLPQQLTASEIDALINSAIAETGASGIGGVGKVMAVIKVPMQGRADMTVVSARVKCLLGV